MLDQYPNYFRKGQIRTIQPLSPPTMNKVMDWVEIMSKIKYFKDYNWYLFGSLSQGFNEPNDMDILMTGGNYRPDIIKGLLDSGLDVGIRHLQTDTEVFYIPNISYLDQDGSKRFGKSFYIYTSYDLVIDKRNGQIRRILDIGQTRVDGLFEHQHSGVLKKWEQTNYQPSRHILLS